MQRNSEEFQRCRIEGFCIDCYDELKVEPAIWWCPSCCKYVKACRDRHGWSCPNFASHRESIEWKERCEEHHKEFRERQRQRLVLSDEKAQRKYDALAKPQPRLDVPLFNTIKGHPDFGKPLVDEAGQPVYAVETRRCIVKGCRNELIDAAILPEELRNEVTCGQHNNEPKKIRRGPINRQKLERALRTHGDRLTPEQQENLLRLVQRRTVTRVELKHRIMKQFFTAEQRKNLSVQHITLDAWRVYLKLKTKDGTRTITRVFELP